MTTITLARSGLTAIWIGLAAILLAQAQGTARAAEECQLRSSDTLGHPEKGTIIGFMTTDQALASIQLTQQRAGGSIDPAYISNTRVRVRVEGRRRISGVLVPENMQVHIGEHVTFITAHRNKALPCNYIPNLITNPIISSTSLHSDARA